MRITVTILGTILLSACAMPPMTPEQQAEQRAASEKINCDMYAMSQDSPGPQGAAAMGRAMEACNGGSVAPTQPVSNSPQPSPPGGPEVIQGTTDRVCVYHLNGGQVVTRTVGPYTPCPYHP